MTTNQQEKGVTDYQSLSALIQEETFDTLTKKIVIQNGWRVLDVGCGTGNNSFKLANLVGEHGHVVATDPIKERIEKAKELYEKPNLEFHQYFGKESPQFGSDFDLAVASTVLHWILPEEKLPTFCGISKCLKENTSFIFNTTKQNTFNGAILFDHIETPLTGKDSKYYPSSQLELEELALNSGFKHVFIEEKEICIVLPSLDHYLKWIASSVHVIDYDILLNELRRACKKDHFPGLYDKLGNVVYKHVYFFGVCTK